MKLFNIIAEALKPSQYRPFVKGWDKSRYADLFKKHHSTDRNHYRIYLPLHGEKKDVKPLPEVEAAVKEAGYEISDYLAGIATKSGDPKRQIKIGKILKDPEIQNKFANDPQRRASKSAEFYIVISRHPYDIAGMSTDRGWKSCMNLKDGVNRHYVPIDVKEGTIIAYVVKADDKNINSPVGRVLIKPFVNTEKPSEIAFGVENRVYGTDVPGFRHQVVEWADSVNNSHDLSGIFELNKKLYNDGGLNRPKILGKNVTDEERIARDPYMIRDIRNPSENIQMAAVVSQPDAIRYIKEPTRNVILKAVEKGGEHIYSILKSNGVKIPEDLVLELFKSKPWFIRFIHNPTVEQFKDAFERGGRHIIHNILEADPPLEVLFWILKQDSDAMYYFSKQSDELHDYLIQHHVKPNDPESWKKISGIQNISKKTLEKLIKLTGGHKVLQHLSFHGGKNKISKKQADAAVQEDPKALRRIPNKFISPAVQLEAALKDTSLVDYIKKDLKKQVIEKYPTAIQYVATGNKMTGKMSMIGHELASIALVKDPKVIRYIEMPTKEMVDHAVKHDPKLLFDIPTKYWTVLSIARAINDNQDKSKIISALKKSRMYTRLWDDVLEKAEYLKTEHERKKAEEEQRKSDEAHKTRTMLKIENLKVGDHITWLNTWFKVVDMKGDWKSGDGTALLESRAGHTKRISINELRDAVNSKYAHL